MTVLSLSWTLGSAADLQVRADLECSLTGLCLFLRLSVMQTVKKRGVSGAFEAVLMKSISHSS